MISKQRVALILLLEGLASSGVQMVTIRQTVAFVGSSVLCTSIIISCFLRPWRLDIIRAGERHLKNLPEPCW